MMKKTLILCLVTFIVLFAMTAIAQEDKTMSFGIKAGLNISNITGDDAGDVKMKMGFGAGGFLSYGLTENIFIQPELLFMLKGSKDDTGYDVITNLGYIELPILLKYVMTMEGDFAPYFFAGPALSYLMSASYHGATVDEEGIMFKEYMNNMDFGIAFGAGIQYTQFTLDIRYTMGLLEVPHIDYYNDTKQKNSNISILVGYAL